MNDIRQEQNRAGREMARSETTNNSSWRVNRPAQKAKKPQGHEAFLKMLETSGAEIELVLLSSGDKVRGVVRHSDKFTVSIKSGEEGTKVYFKHALESFEPTDANREEETKE